MASADHYRGEAGLKYHQRRERLRGDEVQTERAGLFADLVTGADTLLDFGCGTGRLAAALPARKRIGIEINEHAAAAARNGLDQVSPDLSEIETGSVDVVISYHALEHVSEPSAVLSELLRVLRPGGKMRIIVPCEMPVLDKAYGKWAPDDPDLHIFSWTPQTLGNLISTHGFAVTGSRMLPRSAGGRLARLVGGANWARYVKALRTGRFHTEVTAIKPTSSDA